jgi:ribosomal protein S18 acetylase RimI-like enzyme
VQVTIVSFFAGVLEVEELGLAFDSAFAREHSEETDVMLRRELLEGQRFLVALENRGIIGFVSWRMVGAMRHGLAELTHIGLSPFRDRGNPENRHLADRLLGAMEQDAVAVYHNLGGRLRKVFIFTHAENTRAHALYQRNGYGYEATIPSFFRDGVDEHYFSKTFPKGEEA